MSFTINSLSSGSLLDTDYLLKSNTDGGLTKISGASLKSWILGDRDFSSVSSNVSGAIYNLGIFRNYINATPTHIQGSVSLRRFGQDCDLVIDNLAASAAISNGETLYTIPDGYKATSLQERCTGFAVNSSGAMYPLVAYISTNTIKIYPVNANRTIAAGDIIFIELRWHTLDLPA